MAANNSIVAYVCDSGRLIHLLTSIASWQRFMRMPVSIVDIGLSENDHEIITKFVNGKVTFFKPFITQPFPAGALTKQSMMAFAQKTLLGSIALADTIIFLDADMLVVHIDFLNKISAVKPGEMLAMRSAWDSDFSWTYSLASLPFLRRATNDKYLNLDYPICNSGVWSMKSVDAAKVSKKWHKMFAAAVSEIGIYQTLQEGTQIGDQEFLIPACKAAAVNWTPLHGSYNMQVHESKTPWLQTKNLHPHGAYPGEPFEPVRAIHYGCESDGRINLNEKMISSSHIRGWIHSQYQICGDIVKEKIR